MTTVDHAEPRVVGRWYRVAAWSIVAASAAALLAIASALSEANLDLVGTRRAVPCGLGVLALAAALAAARVSLDRIGRVIVRAVLFDIAHGAFVVTAFAVGSSVHGDSLRWPLVVLPLLLLPAVAGCVVTLSLAAKAYFLHMSTQ